MQQCRGSVLGSLQRKRRFWHFAAAQPCTYRKLNITRAGRCWGPCLQPVAAPSRAGEVRWEEVWKGEAWRRHELVSPAVYGVVHLDAARRQVSVVPNWKLDPEGSKFPLSHPPDWGHVFGVNS